MSSGLLHSAAGGWGDETLSTLLREPPGRFPLPAHRRGKIKTTWWFGNKERCHGRFFITANAEHLTGLNTDRVEICYLARGPQILWAPCSGPHPTLLSLGAHFLRTTAVVYTTACEV